MRRTPAPREVERLARKCRALKDWLDGPGRSADPEAFGVVAGAFADLLTAVGALERGPAFLRDLRLIESRARTTAAPTEDACVSARSAESFSHAELVMLTEPVLTASGWLAQAPLLPYARAVRKQLGPTATRKAALEEIIRRWAAATGQSQARAVRTHLKRLEMRASRDEKLAAERPGVSQRIDEIAAALLAAESNEPPRKV